jgi:hypothetical protein
MRFRHWLALWLALCAGAAAAQPVIVDPDPEDDEVDWDLQLEAVPLDAALDAPQGLVFVGDRLNEALLVIEKNTGRVRYFVNRMDQGDARDLHVDNCGQRGLLGIALGPRFDRTTPDTSDPEAPWADYVYLSYYTHPDRLADGCDGPGSEAELRVERFTWIGGLLTDPQRLYTGPLDAAQEELGGVIATALEVGLAPTLKLLDIVYIAIGALGRNGALQNNRAALPLEADDYDDSSVLLRLHDDDDPETPLNAPANPFDLDLDQSDPEDAYFAYGIREPRGIVVDRLAGLPWITDDGATGFDEIGVVPGFSNGGYDEFQGPVDPVPENVDEDGEPNPSYPLVDLATTAEADPAERKPISTYVNPAFSFEDGDVSPTGVAFGGTEVGPRHQSHLFVGTEDGRVMRFLVGGSRQGFLLFAPLADTVANLEIPDDPTTEEPDDPIPADDLTQILIATGFGAISDLETFVDGSLWVVDRENGTLHRIFWDAVRDLAIAGAKVPTKIKVSDKKPVVTKRARVRLENRGEAVERIESPDELDALLTANVMPISGCAAPTVDVVDPKYALPPYNYEIGVAPGGTLDLEVDIAWACDSPTPQGEADFDTEFTIDLNAIGVLDQDPSNNICPRDPAGDDPGCAPKKTPRFLTDLIRK